MVKIRERQRQLLQWRQQRKHQHQSQLLFKFIPIAFRLTSFVRFVCCTLPWWKALSNELYVCVVHGLTPLMGRSVQVTVMVMAWCRKTKKQENPCHRRLGSDTENLRMIEAPQ